jgi:GntR family transcriptional regulator
MNGSAEGGLAPGGTRYKEVKEALLDALAQGEWKGGETIPSEKRLGERFGVSIGTLRKAIDELVAENLLVRHQGLGTFVAEHRRDEHFFRFFRMVRHDGEKTYPSVSLLSFRKGRATQEVAALLQIQPGCGVFHFTNQLSLHGQPVLIDNITLPEARFAGLTEMKLRNRPNTLYHFYQATFGINVIGTDERLRVAVANAREAELLGLPTGAPLLEVRRVAWSYHGIPVEVRISHVDTRDYEYIGCEAPRNSGI